jgi:Na+/proline symporter
MLVVAFGVFVSIPYLFRRLGSCKGRFVVGRRNYGWLSITAGLSTSFIGGAALLNLPSLGFTYGWYGLADVIPSTIGLLLSGFVIAPLIRRTEAVSVGTYLATAGPLVAAASGILGFVVYTLIAAAQLLAMARLLEQHVPLPLGLISALGGLAVAAYIIYGGFASVLLTDRVQFGVMTVLFLGIVGAALLFSTSPRPPGSNPLQVEAMPLDMVVLLGLPLLFLPASQDVHVRIHAASSLRNARLGCIGAAAAYLAFGIVAVSIGVVTARAGTVMDSPDMAAPSYLRNTFGAFAFLPMTAVLAAIISTLDSVLFAAATSLAYDASRWLRRGSEQDPGIPPWLATLVVLTAALAIGTAAPRILSIILPALIIYVAVLLPLLLGVILRVNHRWLAAVALGVLAITLLNELAGWRFPFRAFAVCFIHALLVILGLFLMTRESRALTRTS